MQLWQTQLNFAVWCASSACGVSSVHLNYTKHPMIRSVYCFHVYYHVRRILKKLQTPLPHETSFNAADSPYTESEFFKICEDLECYMDWFLSLICKNYIFKYFVKTIEPTSLKFCMIIELITLHLEYTIAQVKYANFSYAHAQTFVLLNGEMATVSTGFRKLKFWLWLLWTVFYLNQTGF